jgi:glutamyl-tRNA synthetase
VTIRTRIAPSPTGDPHVGTAYVALFNYCFAKKNGGQFLLRIEDTDQTRSTRESEVAILRALRWLGLSWDEGPDVGGPHGPYRQSERGAIYREHCDRLIESGHAFRCFCTAQRLAELRKVQTANGQLPGYDGLCKGLSPAEVRRKIDAGEPYVVRMDVPREGVCVVPDLLRGNIEIDWRNVDMQVLMKSDGMPTYHLANVVDDRLMHITHVLRGEEWISSAPKHLLLYKYFGWDPPKLCHLPLLRNPDKSKLSKRKNPTGILYYQRMGYLPEALLNYLGRMAWSMPDNAEKFTLAQMIENFDLERISLGGPVFDVEKLSWLNGRWIREDLTPDQFGDRVRDWAINRDYMMKIVPLVQQRVERLSDLAPLTGHFFAGIIDCKPEDFAQKNVTPDDQRKILQWGLWHIDALKEWRAAGLNERLRASAEKFGLKVKDFLRPFFVALAGTPVSTPLFETMEILGRDLARARIRHGLEVLGGVSGKQEKEWRREFDLAFGAAEPVEAAD